MSLFVSSSFGGGSYRVSALPPPLKEAATFLREVERVVGAGGEGVEVGRGIAEVLSGPDRFVAVREELASGDPARIGRALKSLTGSYPGLRLVSPHLAALRGMLPPMEEVAERGGRSGRRSVPFNPLVGFPAFEALVPPVQGVMVALWHRYDAAQARYDTIGWPLEYQDDPLLLHSQLARDAIVQAARRGRLAPLNHTVPDFRALARLHAEWRQELERQRPEVFVGRMFRAAREGMTIGRRQLSRKAGLSHQTVYSTEKGVQRPTLETLYRLLRVLGGRLSLHRLYRFYNPEIGELPFFDSGRGVYRVVLPDGVSLESALEQPLSLFLEARLREVGLEPGELADRAVLPLAMIQYLLRGNVYTIDLPTARAIAAALQEPLDLFYIRVHKEIPAFVTVEGGRTGLVLSRPSVDRFDYEALLRSLKRPPTPFGQALRALRGKRGVRQMSRLLGVVPATYYGYEDGAFPPSMEAFLGLCCRSIFRAAMADFYRARYPLFTDYNLVEVGTGTLPISPPTDWGYRQFLATTFGAVLRTVRDRQKSLREFAEALGLSHSFVIDLEKDVVLDVPYDLVRKIAEVGGEDLGFLAVLAHPELWDIFEVVDRRDRRPLKPSGVGRSFDYRELYRLRLERSRRSQKVP